MGKERFETIGSWLPDDGDPGEPATPSLLERLFPQIARVLKINELEAITDDVIEAAASILFIGN